jgi:hypothetical protein
VIPLIGQFFPLFELVDVEAGHWVISEKPEAFKDGKCCCPEVCVLRSLWLC